MKRSCWSSKLLKQQAVEAASWKISVFWYFFFLTTINTHFYLAIEARNVSGELVCEISSNSWLLRSKFFFGLLPLYTKKWRFFGGIFPDVSLSLWVSMTFQMSRYANTPYKLFYSYFLVLKGILYYI